MALPTAKIQEFVSEKWDKEIIPCLEEYIRIPNQSPMFDSEWETNGLQEKAVDLIVNWVKAQDVKGLSVDVIVEKGRTPLVFMEVAPTTPGVTDTVMLYGHLDKQPPMKEAWDPKFGSPWNPKLIDGKLYGRGGADDGYSAFAAVTAIKALQMQGIPHGRCVITIESCEESQSADLPYYCDLLKDRIGIPTIIVCLDSGCGTYDRLWLTSSLRGAIAANLTVEILTEGVHSGKASGIVPSSFRILRQLLSRIDDENTGKIIIPELIPNIPEDRIQEAKDVSDMLGDAVVNQFPFVSGASADKNISNHLHLLNATWQPTLSITGMSGLPNLDVAGNVLRTHTSVKLSVRLAPNTDTATALAALERELTRDPPYGAKITFEESGQGSGWNCPLQSDWLKQAVNDASMAYFNKPVRRFGEGGSIPFMYMLGEKFPKTQFVVTGVLGPNSNAHGPNEFLHIGMGKGVTCAVANILAAHHVNCCQ